MSDDPKALEDNVRKCLRFLEQQERTHAEGRRKLLLTHSLALEESMLKETKPCCRYTYHVSCEEVLTQVRRYL
ncbi:hypothetical protein LCGC14_2859380, partial [marine sediment metagenome]